MARIKRYYVYILVSLSGTLYIGITSNLEKRMFEHKEGLIEGFTKKYEVHRLVYFESFDDVRTAINREKQLKGWRRQKKIALIERMNPSWRDLARDWYEGRGPSTRVAEAATLAQDDRDLE